ncbi:hypothetical protein OIU84_009165 [Salix udensis]|uniref:Uncharacterized protein n=1 Tax=Salix udensis TaxID=889485 RepID=A0AAD6NYJ5_9ROSI|nr:hypothetical protein OIU84_009165 [Salix udensis]
MRRMKRIKLKIAEMNCTDRKEINIDVQFQPRDRLPERLIELTFMGVATTSGASGESLTA